VRGGTCMLCRRPGHDPQGRTRRCTRRRSATYAQNLYTAAPTAGENRMPKSDGPPHTPPVSTAHPGPFRRQILHRCTRRLRQPHAATVSNARPGSFRRRALHRCTRRWRELHVSVPPPNPPPASTK
jgi:hypothetical protein